MLVLESQGCHDGAVLSNLEQNKLWKAVCNKCFHQPKKACAVTVADRSLDDCDCLTFLM